MISTTYSLSTPKPTHTQDQHLLDVATRSVRVSHFFDSRREEKESKASERDVVSDERKSRSNRSSSLVRCRV